MADVSGLQASTILNKSTIIKSQKAIEETRTLTGVETKSDAWGKVIPVTFGRTRVPGSLIWASNYYKSTTGFDETFTQRDKYFSAAAYDLAPGLDFEPKPGQYYQTDNVSQIVRNTVTSTNIDLCYSFGKEGDPRRKRFVDKMRINDIVVYDSKTNYYAPGLAFAVRYGYDNTINPVMAGYPNGDLFYPGQTLVIFNKFPTASFGDKIPDRVDVEFGCIMYEPPIVVPSNCFFFQRVVATRNNDKIYIDNESTIEFNFVNPTMIVYTVFEPIPMGGGLTFDKFTVLGQKAIAGGTVSVIYKQLSLFDNTEYNGRNKTTVKRNGVDIDGATTVVEVLEYFNFPFDSNYDPWPKNGLFGPVVIEQGSGPYSQQVAGPAYASLSLMQGGAFTHTAKTIAGQGDTIDATGSNYTAVLYSVNNPCFQIL